MKQSSTQSTPQARFRVTPSGALNCTRLRPDLEQIVRLHWNPHGHHWCCAAENSSRADGCRAARIGMDLAERDRTGMWEQLAFIVVWFCGFSVSGIV